MTHRFCERSLKRSTIVILDDDEYIHRIWDERFSKRFLSENDLKILHFINPKELMDFCKKSPIHDMVFFLNYELGNNQLTGLDVVGELSISDCATLVTSRYEDDDVRKICQDLNIKIIPKFFAEIVSINVYDKTEIVLIENEKPIASYWKKCAEANGKSISVFYDPNDFMKIINHFHKETTIYIDSSLDNSVKGEEFAKVLYEKGYNNLILATGYPKSRFEKVTWVKDIVGKEPPWGES